MTRRTALTIQNPDNDIRCEPYAQDQSTKKWAGAINLYRQGDFHTTLVSSIPIYESMEAAVAGMNEVVQKVKDMTLITM